jgi:mitochondrial distribution and morphology protein 31
MSVVCRVSAGLSTHSAGLSLTSQAVPICPRASAAATLDRYTIIRNYFRRQTPLSYPGSSSLNQNSSSRHTLYTMRTIAVRYHCKPVSDTLSRAFHATSLRQNEDGKPSPSQSEQASPKKTQVDPESNPNLDNYSTFFRRLALSVPHLHRPTKDDLLTVTTGFWQRARVRFKWFTIKSFRRWNADDISAFFTWFLMTQTVWILVGT